MGSWDYKERQALGGFWLADAKKRFRDVAYHLSFSNRSLDILRTHIKSRMTNLDKYVPKLGNTG